MCKWKNLLPLLLILSWAAPPASGGEDKFPYRVQRLGERLVFIKAGSSDVMSNVTALAAKKGLVVIETLYAPEYGKRVRDLIVEQFGREDFAWLLHTHAGVDHIGGDEAFPEAVLVEHENGPQRTAALYEALETRDVRELMAPRLDLIQKQIDAGPSDPARLGKLHEARLYWGELTDLFASGYRHRRADLTFNDTLTLDLGDLRIEMVYITPGYSDNDVLIYVPEEQLLLTGDAHNRGRIPLLDKASDIERWAAVLRPFVEGKREVRYIIGCHGEPMTQAELKEQIDYVRDLAKAVEEAERAGRSLEEAKRELALARRFPHLTGLQTRWVSTPFDLHERNIEQLWSRD